MKKTGFFLTAVLLAALLVFTGCGSRDDNSDAVPDSEQNSVTEDIKDGAEDVKDDASDIGEDLKRGASDVGEDIKRGASDVGDDIRDGADDAADDMKGSDVNRDYKDRNVPSEVQ